MSNPSSPWYVMGTPPTRWNANAAQDFQPKAILKKRWVWEPGQEKEQVQYQVFWVSWVTPDASPLQALIDNYEAQLREESASPR